MKILLALVIACLFSVASFAGSPGEVCDHGCGDGVHTHPMTDHDHPTDPIIWKPTGIYFGVGAGVSNMDYEGSSGKYGRGKHSNNRTTSGDRDGIAFRAFGGHEGYSFLDDKLSLGAELGYANIGDIPEAKTITALDLTAALRWNINTSWRVIARAGNAWWDVANADGSDTTYALGGEYVQDHLFIRAEYQDYEIASEDASTMLASIGYRF